VCAVTKVESATFHPDTQTVEAIVTDSRGDRAVVRHPFTSRGSEGAERLLAKLAQAPDSLRFVAGPMRLTVDGLAIEPIALVWDGSTRLAIQPWIDRLDSGQTQSALPHAESRSLDPIEDWSRALLESVGSLMVTGLRRADASVLRAWQELHGRAEQLGLVRLGAVVGRVASGLADKALTLQWNWQPTAQALLELALLARTAQEMLA
ncbi:MAG: hypothetical protein L0241_21025, partial [Planctomycetia bacterium]|nr:hypothetical protein [Planctomycetia bacterium]